MEDDGTLHVTFVDYAWASVGRFVALTAMAQREQRRGHPDHAAPICAYAAITMLVYDLARVWVAPEEHG